MSELSFSDVGEILAIVDRIDCESFHLEYGDVKISISQSGTGAELATPAPVPPTSRPQVVVHEQQPQEQQAAEPQPETAGTDGWEAVTAAMAGTFYRGPEPGKPPWVSVGDLVEVGQTVCVLEVMKLFTELKAERAGVVARIDAQDGALVEYEQPLVWIDPR